MQSTTISCQLWETDSTYRTFKNKNVITYPKSISLTSNPDEQYNLKFVGNHIGRSLHVGHYHGYIREAITDTSENQSWYKAEDSEEVKTISDKMVKQDLSNAYSLNVKLCISQATANFNGGQQ